MQEILDPIRAAELDIVENGSAGPNDLTGVCAECLVF